jgi:hypothetical protein
MRDERWWKTADLFLSLLPLKSLIEAVIHRVTLLKLLTTARAVLLLNRGMVVSFEKLLKGSITWYAVALEANPAAVALDERTVLWVESPGKRPSGWILENVFFQKKIFSRCVSGLR